MLMLSGLLGVAVLGSVMMIGGDATTETEEEALASDRGDDPEAEAEADVTNVGALLAQVAPITTEGQVGETSVDSAAPRPPEGPYDGPASASDVMATVCEPPIHESMHHAGASDFADGTLGVDGADTPDAPDEESGDVNDNTGEIAPEDVGDDTIMGTNEDDVVTAGDGDSTTYLGGGDDSATGGGGDDIMSGGNGDDTLSGEDGFDQISGNDGDDNLSGGTDNDTVLGGDGHDRVLGGDDNDTLSGDSGRDFLSGDDGDDELFGGGDDDILLGGAGRDTLNGDEGNDILVGDDDSALDFLTGGAGDDSIHAGEGDVVHGGFGSDTVFVDEGQNVSLVDFRSGEDILQVTIAGNPAEAEIGFTYDPEDDMTLILVNGTAAAAVYGDVTLTPEDISLVAA